MKKIAVALVLCMLAFCYASAQVVINEVYGGGGNSGATLRNDFVELYNKGNTAVSLSGWSLQYNSATASNTSAWQTTALSGTIPANGYYLIQLAQGTGGTTNLPTPDATGTLALSGTAGRVALVNNNTALVGCPAAAQYVDLVGYGSTTTCFEGAGPAPAPASNSTSIQRKQTGGVPDDSNNNSADFASGAPTPQASGVATSTATVSVTGDADAAEPATAGRFTITFNPATTTSTNVDFAFGGTATYGTDYTASASVGTINAASGTLTVPASTAAVTITITPINDATVEGTETVSLALSNPTQSYVLGASSATINLTDDDAAQPTGTAFTVGPSTAAAEPATNGAFGVSLSIPAPAGGVTINYTISSLTGRSVAGVDYTDPNNGQITIPQNSASALLPINVIDDNRPEAGDSLIVTLVSSSNPAITIGTNNRIALLLSDNDIAVLQPITLSGGVYSQNFDSLSRFGVSGFLPQGWAISESGANANNLYTASEGNGTTGDTYSFGLRNNSDRALGSLSSGSLESRYGAVFANKTGKPITSLTINYVGEQWRLGSRNRYDSLVFGYALNTANIGTNNFIAVEALKFLTVDTTSANLGQNNGDSSAFRRTLSFTINGLNVPADSLFALRWADNNIGGNDDGLAIDSFSLSYTLFTDVTPPTITNLNPPNGAAAFASNQPLQISFSENVVKGSGNISINNITDGTSQSIAVTSTAVVVNGNVVTINAALTGGKQYSVIIPVGAFLDVAGNAFAGLSSGWTFTAFTPDTVRPTVVSLTPANGSTGVSVNPTFSIKFSERIIAGNGAILIRKVSDNSDAAVVPLTSVVVVDSAATFTVTGLQPLTNYYVYFPDTTFRDAAGNFATGFDNSTRWRFTTGTITAYNFNFNDCALAGAPGSGFRQFSVLGDSVWNCTGFGFTGNGAQINGFSSGGVGARDNDDWLISPPLNLTGFNVPILSFRMRTRFTGPQLQVLVSTNYGGSGRPDTLGATWVPLQAQLAAPNSDVWVLVDSINLSAYKSANTFIAFRYTASLAAGASRTTIDDVSIGNSASAPLPVVTLRSQVVNFDYAAPGSTSTSRLVQITALNASSGLTITATGPFEVSTNNVNFSNSVSFTGGDLNTSQNLFVRFVPTAANAVFNGTLQIGNGANAVVQLLGNTYPRTTTLDVVNWNIEWFGSPAQSPADDNLQQANAKRIMDSLNADVYALAEIVDTARLGALTRSLTGSYSYVVSDYASNATSPSSGNWASAQKLAFVYRNGTITNVRTRGMLRTNQSSFVNWASGRTPFLMTADVVNGAATARYNFVVLHAKANTGTTADQIGAYNERTAAARELKDTLDAFFASERIIILGDYNDDLDSTIAPITGPKISSYSDWVADSVDANSYRSITLPLSRARLQSTVDNDNVVDHQIISNEVAPDYLPGTARLVTEVETYISNFGGTTSDHYPVMSRFLLPAVVTSIPTVNAAEMSLVIMPNPVRSTNIQFSFKATAGNTVYRITDVHGRVLAQSAMQRLAAGVRTERWNLPQMTKGTYLLEVFNGGKRTAQLFLKD